MLKKIWHYFSPPARPPWETLTGALSNTAEYTLLHERQSDAFKALPLHAANALGIWQDRYTGQLWEDYIFDDGPCPLYGTRPYSLGPTPGLTWMQLGRTSSLHSKPALTSNQFPQTFPITRTPDTLEIALYLGNIIATDGWAYLNMGRVHLKVGMANGRPHRLFADEVAVDIVWEDGESGITRLRLSDSANPAASFIVEKQRTASFATPASLRIIAAQTAPDAYLMLGCLGFMWTYFDNQNLL